jgi:hypothetical protein
MAWAMIVEGECYREPAALVKWNQSIIDVRACSGIIRKLERAYSKLCKTG